MPLDSLYEEAVDLLKSLIATESFSRQEENTAAIIHAFFKKNSIEAHRERNNLWAFNKHYHPDKPTILLNSHHDTVKPNKDWTKDPFTPTLEEGKLFGLGSNDAGGCLVALITTFLHYYEQENLAYNLVMAATAEEEVSGVNGLELIIPQLGPIQFAIVGEPTQMHLAIAEKGLMVLDCVAKGTSGHAAREEGDNAIYRALPDINWFQNFKFPIISEFLGLVKMSVTVIKAGTQHNVVPDSCEFTVDVRVTDAYTNEEVLEIIKAQVDCDVKPRSMRLKPSRIGKETTVVQAGLALGRNLYGSPTTSDQALLTVPSLKLGPGDSARSHTADEFIYLSEIQEGIELYIKILDQIIYQ
ncbi:M20 family metallo-hydrolase [Adhaeribacter radiodurans]|uniref:M20 family metallo-hydrolase n=1 Tax=Adhaeribacter radiodurans TaxID=2745197 RepID=A0A7L7L785_9BACT|nr:M20 family metallo-hydrolase [Adhaeribacter radiodurans]QMU28614.1 M20 family metallo-hydrolase [Adhaeribacter radiodurans]